MPSHLPPFPHFSSSSLPNQFVSGSANFHYKIRKTTVCLPHFLHKSRPGQLTPHHALFSTMFSAYKKNCCVLSCPSTNFGTPDHKYQSINRQSSQGYAMGPRDNIVHQQVTPTPALLYILHVGKGMSTVVRGHVALSSLAHVFNHPIASKPPVAYCTPWGSIRYPITLLSRTQ